ncbi:cytochrome c [Gluconacetobacter sp. 1b LMG 1731]|uniref:Cytochrome c n=1 Tax=Gluconacetobacter dulcium TaxID=2729096 RepID=A0A7W4IP50_9PROT|nr:c-type cytochrome [Gluconacetobacter dulcium]MBB2166354.1 cytochrome c [Gluconacetobacter dulcium]MBB2195480.1 cytochrome c [Gluconacetobacter dulcium]
MTMRIKSTMAACMAALTLGMAPAHPLAAATPCAEPAHGADLYRTACAMCHGTRLEGNFETPALTGRFVANWAGAPVSELEAYVHRAMPLMAPGTLSPDDTRAVVAFLLAANDLPQGKTVRVGARTRSACPS